MSPEKKRNPPDGFVDPLSNYDKKDYDDPLEKVLATENVEKISSRPFGRISPDASLLDGIRALAGQDAEDPEDPEQDVPGKDVGCLVVEREGKLVGIFADWDVLHKVSSYDALSSVSIGEVMTEDPFVVHDSDSVATSLTVMALHGCRHVPVLNDNGEVVGVVNPRRLATFLESAMP